MILIPRLMQQLQQDHKKILFLMGKLEKYAEDLKKGKDSDLQLIIDIVNYIRNYNDKTHHPIEDEIYFMFKTQSKEASELLYQILDEHSVINKVSINFEQLINGALNGAAILSRQELSIKITNYIDIQKNHIHIEEAKLFPLINKTLKEVHWEELEERITKKFDPLLGSQAEVQFETLQATL